MNIRNPKLTIVGAGPGDIDLITVKAIKVLKTADVVLYDALVKEEILDYTNPKSKLIFVGKRKGCYAYQQEQINELIVAHAQKFGHVVRLKGGDPFIFGRGGEEIESLLKNKINFQVVPGITAANGISAYAGIPL
ncbi:MAG: uroporphyrinogen-III C-methyltransferase, partial [Polaribacter sp.]|nr:uroporphyrinogen-III C-methyltransferase [Polaribacter sp.]